LNRLPQEGGDHSRFTSAMIEGNCCRSSSQIANLDQGLIASTLAGRTRTNAMFTFHRILRRRFLSTTSTAACQSI
jgi:hypothetical protein